MLPLIPEILLLDLNMKPQVLLPRMNALSAGIEGYREVFLLREEDMISVNCMLDKFNLD